jgi:hypothetical protein
MTSSERYEPSLKRSRTGSYALDFTRQSRSAPRGGHRAEQHVGPTKAPVAEQEHPRPKGPDQVERKRVPARLVASHRDIYKRVRTALAEADEADLSERRALTPSRCRTTELAVVQRRGGRPSQHPERGMIGETLVGLRPDPPCSRYRRRMP